MPGAAHCAHSSTLEDELEVDLECKILSRTVSIVSLTDAAVFDENPNRGPMATRVASFRRIVNSGTFVNDPRSFPRPHPHSGLEIKVSKSIGFPFVKYSQVSECCHVLQRSARTGIRRLYARVSSSEVIISVMSSEKSSGNREVISLLFSSVTGIMAHASRTTV